MSTNTVPLYQSAASWDSHAKDYQMPHKGFAMTIVKDVISSLSAIRPFSSEYTSFLDDGCGTGNLIAHLIDSHGQELPPSARLIAADFSSGMIDRVSKLKAAEANPVWQKVETLVQDAMNLNDIADAEITHVGSAACIFMVPDPQKAIEEAHRVLVPGGAFAWSSFKSILHQPALEVLSTKMGLEIPNHIIPAQMRSEQGVSEAMKQAGFVNIRTSASKMTVPLPPDQRSFWSGMFRSGNPGMEEMMNGWSLEQRDNAAKLVATELEAKGLKELVAETIVVAGQKKPVA